jgi:hypothetical protein
LYQQAVFSIRPRRKWTRPRIVPKDLFSGISGSTLDKVAESSLRIANTLDDPSESAIEDEIRDLFNALAR